MRRIVFANLFFGFMVLMVFPACAAMAQLKPCMVIVVGMLRRNMSLASII
jgi:hypothetical protein